MHILKQAIWLQQKRGKMPKNEKSKLPDMPPSKDTDFWQGEIEIIEMHEKQRCLHGGNLIMRPDKQAFCINCGAGWFLDGRDDIKDGHLYRDLIKII